MLFKKCISLSKILKLYCIFVCDNWLRSAMFTSGKNSVLQLCEIKKIWLTVQNKLQNWFFKPQSIITKGIPFLVTVYGGLKEINRIDKYRYLTFVKNTKNNLQVQLFYLSPTSTSAIQHLSSILSSCDMTRQPTEGCRLELKMNK